MANEDHWLGKGGQKNTWYKWTNPQSNEMFMIRQREDGKREMKFGQKGTSLAGKTVFDSNRNLCFARRTDHTIIADDLLAPSSKLLPLTVNHIGRNGLIEAPLLRPRPLRRLF